jgi:hypothetical protein
MSTIKSLRCLFERLKDEPRGQVVRLQVHKADFLQDLIGRPWFIPGRVPRP